MSAVNVPADGRPVACGPWTVRAVAEGNGKTYTVVSARGERPNRVAMRDERITGDRLAAYDPDARWARP